jgi:hypothetical protein
MVKSTLVRISAWQQGNACGLSDLLRTCNLLFSCIRPSIVAGKSGQYTQTCGEGNFMRHVVCRDTDSRASVVARKGARIVP